MIDFFLMAFFAAKSPAPFQAPSTSSGQAAQGDQPALSSSKGTRRAPDGGARAPVTSQGANPVAIESDDLEIFDKKHVAYWIGHVKAKSGTTDISCNRLTAHYAKSQSQEKEITTIECVGNAEVQDGDKWARGERADFDNRTGVLVVTGSPEAKQGTTHVRGTKVIFYRAKDNIKVENARTVFQTGSDGALAPKSPAKDSKPPKGKK
jgi:lipopolysaccharide export system protein LptA